MVRPVVLLAATAACGGAAYDGPEVRRLENQTFFPDVSPASCQVAKACNQGGIPLERGLCVQELNGNFACWDVCNTNHGTDDFQINANTVVTAAIKGMVETVRSGLNPAVKCPGLKSGDPCPPGDACPADMLKASKVPDGRGICVVDSKGHFSRSCWDMCDTTRSLMEFTVGSREGTATFVSNVRASSACPHLVWWWVLLTILGVVAIVLICIGLALFLRKVKSTAASRKASSELQEDFGDRLNDEDEMPEDAEGAEYGTRDYALENEENQPFEQMPPEPPRVDSHGMGQQMQDMPPAPQYYQDTGPAGMTSRSGGAALSMPAGTPMQMPTQAYRQYSSPTMSPGGRPIPGLEEPANLLNLTQTALQQQQQYGAMTTAIAAPPVGAPYSSFTAPVYSGVHPQVGGPSFQTLPPQSLHMTVGQMGGQQVFTAPPRRA